MKAPEALPLGYVEDAFDARTMLVGCFSIRCYCQLAARTVCASCGR